MVKLRLGCALLAAMLSCFGGAQAKEYPSGPITFVVPYPAGGGVDAMARIVAAGLQEKWGQSIVIENRAGGNGRIAAEHVSMAAPNGHTLLVAAEGPLVMNQSLYSKLSYDPEAFAPVTVISSSPMFLSVRPSVPVNSFEELITYAKAHPGELRYGTSGVGAPSHLSGVMLEMRTGVKFSAIPYKGSAQSLNDFLGDHINMLFAFQTSAGRYFDTDKIRVLAVTGPERHPSFPNIPAIAETLPGFEAQSWVAMVAPPGTPPEITNQLSQAVVEVLKSPDVVKQIADLGSATIGNTPEQAGVYLKEEAERWGKVIRSAGIKVD